ncbi:SLC18A1_2 [Mytilus coruscus]|uniref:SLC18A1_2 n=1 Tax=Mytilus coruscus TaxID=42192 RepID=A0A6J8DRT3_MYTCO|nr:SLC18A1_2 [Mytilus coruscus]
MLVIQDEQMMEDCLDVQNQSISNTSMNELMVKRCLSGDDQTVNISLNLTTDAPSTSFSSISVAKRLFALSFNPATENSKLGWILAVKALVQIVFNPLTGYLANSFGNNIVLLGGTIIIGISSLVYSISSSVPGLLIARGMHGLGSSATNVAGMSLLAERYHEDGERSRVMGIAMAGIAVGVLIGYPFGSLLYFYVGSSAPFLFIMVFVVLDIAFIILVCKPVLLEKRSYHGSTITVLLRDPYILVGACIIMLATMSISTVEATVPIWVLDTMDVEKWELAVLFIPDSAGYVIGTNFFGNLALKMGRTTYNIDYRKKSTYRSNNKQYHFEECSQMMDSQYDVFVANRDLFDISIIDAAIVPLLALLVDTRHVAMYGCVYAINQLAVCLAYGLGPGIAGQIVKGLGFSWSMWALASVIILVSPICIFLKRPPVEQENKPILEDKETIQIMRVALVVLVLASMAGSLLAAGYGKGYGGYSGGYGGVYGYGGGNNGYGGGNYGYGGGNYGYGGYGGKGYGGYGGKGYGGYGGHSYGRAMVVKDIVVMVARAMVATVVKDIVVMVDRAMVVTAIMEKEWDITI